MSGAGPSSDRSSARGALAPRASSALTRVANAKRSRDGPRHAKGLEPLIRCTAPRGHARRVHDGLARQNEPREIEVRHPTSVRDVGHGQRSRAPSKRAMMRHRETPARHGPRWRQAVTCRDEQRKCDRESRLRHSNQEKLGRARERDDAIDVVANEPRRSPKGASLAAPQHRYRADERARRIVALRDRLNLRNGHGPAPVFEADAAPTPLGDVFDVFVRW